MGQTAAIAIELWLQLKNRGVPSLFFTKKLIENTDPKSFTPIEMVSIGRAIEHDIAEASEKRMMAGKRVKGDEDEPYAQCAQGKTRDIVAKLLGNSSRTYERAKAVVKGAKIDPGTFD